MFLGIAHHALVIAPTDRDVSLRAVGLGFTAVAFLLALLSPVFAPMRLRVAPAQMAAALYSVLAAAGTLIVAGVVAVAFPGAAGDRLSVDGILLTVTLIFLLSGILARIAWRGLGTKPLGYGMFLMWPIAACLFLDVAVVGDVWLTAGAHDATGAGGDSIHTGALVLAGFTLLTALATLAEPVILVARLRRDTSMFRFMAIPAAVAATGEIALVTLRGPESWYTGTHTAGVELLMANIAFGLTAYLIAFTRIRPRGVLAGTVTTAAERWEPEYSRAA